MARGMPRCRHLTGKRCRLSRARDAAPPVVGEWTSSGLLEGWHLRPCRCRSGVFTQMARRGPVAAGKSEGYLEICCAAPARTAPLWGSYMRQAHLHPRPARDRGPGGGRAPNQRTLSPSRSSRSTWVCCGSCETYSARQGPSGRRRAAPGGAADPALRTTRRPRWTLRLEPRQAVRGAWAAGPTPPDTESRQAPVDERVLS